MLTTWSILTLSAKIPEDIQMVQVEKECWGKKGWGHVEPEASPLPRRLLPGILHPKVNVHGEHPRPVAAIAWPEKEESGRKVDSWPVPPLGAAC